MNLGPMMLVGTLETLGTHFKIPLGTENLLTHAVMTNFNRLFFKET